jgi:anti-sigma B factor antagonist
MELSMASRTWQDWTIIEVAGELDLNTAPALRQHIDGEVEAGAKQVAIEMSQVSFMDSTGLGMLVSVLKRLDARDGRMALVGIEGSPRKVVSITGVDERIPIVDRVEDLPSV